jgi:hypothetical protein
MGALDDESAPLFAAMSAFAGVMWRVPNLMLETLQAMRAEARPEVTADDVKAFVGEQTSKMMMGEMIRSMDRMLALRQKALVVRTALIAIGATVVVLGGLWLWFQPFCWDQPGGGRVCGVWVGR